MDSRFLVINLLMGQVRERWWVSLRHRAASSRNGGSSRIVRPRYFTSRLNDISLSWLTPGSHDYRRPVAVRASTGFVAPARARHGGGPRAAARSRGRSYLARLHRVKRLSVGNRLAWVALSLSLFVARGCIVSGLPSLHYFPCALSPGQQKRGRVIFTGRVSAARTKQPPLR